ncbi:MAG: hypothetical protein R2752_02430 [Vicinamibacterales bacterium]
MRRLPLVIALALLAGPLLGPVAAKGPTVLVTVTGPGLPGEIEVTDPAALADVWGAPAGCGTSDRFFTASAAAPDRTLPRYDVAFHVRIGEAGTTASRVMYLVRFAWDPVSGLGFVYLPGPGDAAYAVNRGTIMRGVNDGRWFRASARWAGAIQRGIIAATAH